MKKARQPSQDQKLYRNKVLVMHARAVEPVVHPNAVASLVEQEIDDIECRFDVEGPLCWRDPFTGAREASS
jgi:hypothetical protein